jgi:hypothetical protein
MQMEKLNSAEDEAISLSTNEQFVKAEKHLLRDALLRTHK